MNRDALRIGAVTVAAALTLGVAGHAASAATHEGRETTTPARSATVTTGMTPSEARELLSIPEFRAELTAAEQAQMESVARGETQYSTQVIGAAAKALVKLIKKYGPSFYDKAVAAAKKGLSKFKEWAGDLAWYHPVRLAVLAASDWVIRQVIDALT